MSLRWRCAPAYGSEVMSFCTAYPALAALRAGLFSVAPAALGAWAALKIA